MDNIIVSTPEVASAPSPTLRDRMSATLLDTAENAGKQIGEATEEAVMDGFICLM